MIVAHVESQAEEDRFVLVRPLCRLRFFATQDVLALLLVAFATQLPEVVLVARPCRR